MATGAASVRQADALQAPEQFLAPRLLRTALLAPLPGLVPLVLWAAGEIHPVAAVLAGGLLAIAAGAHIGSVRFDLWRCRRTADEVLLADRRGRASSPLLAWRAGELTSERSREHLAGWVRGVIREAESARRRIWTPLNRAAAMRNLFLLRRLELRLADLSRPVLPRGMLVVRELLADGMTSPLYCRDRAEELPDALAGALADLDVPR